MGTWFGIRFLFGLYVYIRLLQLSIDRAGDEFRAEVVCFLKSMGVPSPDNVSSVLDTVVLQKKPSLISRMLSKYGNKSPRVWIPGAYLDRFRSALHRSSSLLGPTDSQREEDRNSVRLALAEVEATLLDILPSAMATSGSNVDHLNSAAAQNLRRFDEIVANDWLASIER